MYSSARCNESLNSRKDRGYETSFSLNNNEFKEIDTRSEDAVAGSKPRQIHTFQNESLRR